MQQQFGGLHGLLLHFDRILQAGQVEIQVFYPSNRADDLLLQHRGRDFLVRPPVLQSVLTRWRLRVNSE